MLPLSRLSATAPPRRGRALARLCLAPLALALLWAAPSAFAATRTVTSGGDSGSGTLRAAVAAATAGDTIIFSGVTTVTLTSGQIALTKPVTVSGPGVTVSAGGASRVFEVAAGPTTLAGLTITQGHASNGGNGDTEIVPAGGIGANGPGEGYGTNGGAGANGGGVLVDANANLTLSDCTLTGNSAGTGGTGGSGVGSHGSLADAYGVVGYYGGAGGTGGAGGGLYISGGANVTLSDCTLTGNNGGSGGSGGNGADVTESLPPYGLGDDFYGGNGGIGGTGGAGGDIAISGAASVTLWDCVLTGNSANNGGSGGSAGILQNKVGSDGADGAPGAPGPGGGGGAVSNAGALTLGRCALSGNSAGTGGGLYNTNGATATLTNCDLSNNSDQGSEGGGGAIFNAGGGTVTLTRCRVSHNQDAANSASGSGGGGGICNQGVAALADCTLSDNVSGNSQAVYQGGGGFYNSGQAMLNECTLSGNSSSLGSAIENYSGMMTLTNDIVYGDHSVTNLSEIVALSGSSASVSHCDIQGGVPRGATDSGGNLSTDPRFVRAPGTNGSADAGDLHLQAGSPCIGAGTGSAPGNAPFDLDGAPRFNPPTIGAYEGSGYALVVTNTNPSGPGSLAAAITSANTTPGAVITFDPSVFETRQQTIAVSNVFTVGARMTISGPPQGVVLDGGNANRIFYVNSGATVALSGLQLQHGNASSTGFGGALYSEGSVTLTDCVLAANSAASGGAVFTRGIVILTDCVLLGNTATSGGALYNASNLTSGAGGQAALTECTLTGNRATNGGGVYNGANSANYLTLTDDILWNDTASNGPRGLHLQQSRLRGLLRHPGRRHRRRLR